MPGSGGIDYPGDVHKLLGDLYLATGRLPQCWIRSPRSSWPRPTGAGSATTTGDPALVADLAAMKLEVARARASDLTSNLQAAQNAIASLRVAGGSDA